MAGLLSADDLQAYPATDGKPMDGSDRAHAISLDVVSPNEAVDRQIRGNAPQAMVIDTQAGSLKPNPRPPEKRGLLTANDVAPSDVAPTPDDPEVLGEQALMDPKQNPVGPHQAGVMLKGALKGAASPITFPADVSIGAVNFVKRVMGFGDSTLNTNASDLVEKGLVAAGLPKNQPGTGDEALDTASGVIGGLASLSSAGKLAAKAVTDKDFWSAAGAASSQNRQIVNALWAKKIGEDGVTKLTPAVIGRASDRIGAVLDNTRSTNHIYLASPEEIGGQIGAINGNSTPVTNTVLKNNTVQKLLDTFSSGHATAEDLGNISSQLGKAAKTSMRSDYETGAGLLKVKDYVEGLIQEGLEPGQAQAYAQARQQYANLLKVQRFVNPGTGDLNAPALGRYLQRTESAAYTRGGNSEPAYEVIRKAQGVSGTKPGSLMPPIIKAAMRTVPGGAQYVMQKGVQPGLRMLVNKPGFMTALSSELARTGDDIPETDEHPGEEQQ
jgi:hypothetical protein